jgi:hypothetical protein
MAANPIMGSVVAFVEPHVQKAIDQLVAESSEELDRQFSRSGGGGTRGLRDPVEEIGHEHARKALHVLDGMAGSVTKAHRPEQKKARLAELLAEQPSRPVPYLADHLRLGHSTVYRWMAK